MNKKIIYGIIAIILIIGIVRFFTGGFNLGLAYGDIEKVEVNVGQKVSKEEMNEIVNFAFGDSKYRVQTIEIFEDFLSITVKSSSEEQIDRLVQIINERYSQELTKDDVNIIKIPSSSIWQISKAYVVPSIIIIAITAVYMGLRFWKLSFFKMFALVIVNSVLSFAVLASMYLITGCAINELTMPLSLMILALTLFAMSNYFENKLIEVKNKEKEL